MIASLSVGGGGERGKVPAAARPGFPPGRSNPGSAAAAGWSRAEEAAG